jgi:hypothetical protein
VRFRSEEACLAESTRGSTTPRSRTGFVLFATILAAIFVATTGPAEAQTPIPPVPARITAPVDETALTTLRGNTHPLARPEFDEGAAADSQPLRRMLLLLKRSSAQEAALKALLDQQQSNHRQTIISGSRLSSSAGSSGQLIRMCSYTVAGHNHANPVRSVCSVVCSVD